MGEPVHHGTCPFIRPMLAHSYRPERDDPVGYWMSEKLDGVRACWTGDRLLSRTGKPFAPPADWLAWLPDGIALDGELTLGRGRFQDTVSVVRTTKGPDKGWDRVNYCVFDAPSVSGGFEERLLRVRRVLVDNNEEAANPLRLVDQTRCRDRAHLDTTFRAVVAGGGEGIMLRAPKSKYTVGKRSRLLLKVKEFHDAEAEVVAHVPGRGKHAGRLGALRVRCPTTGVEFKVGTGLNDAQRAAPPSVGALITYRYQERTRSGAPRFPVFMRVRPITPHGCPDGIAIKNSVEDN